MTPSRLEPHCPDHRANARRSPHDPLVDTAADDLTLAAPALGADLQGTLKKIKTTNTITLGYRDSSRPFSFVGDDGKPAGYSVDLCTGIAASIGKQLALPNLQAKWVKVTVADRMQLVANGTVDLECGSTTASLSRQEEVDFSLLTFVDGGSLLVTDASGIRGVSTLGGKRVGIIPGTTTEKSLADALKKHGVNATMVPVKDHAEGVTALDKGTADAYASDRVILIGIGRTSKDPAKLSLVQEFFSYEPYGFMLRRERLGLPAVGQPRARDPVSIRRHRADLREVVRIDEHGRPAHRRHVRDQRAPGLAAHRACSTPPRSSRTAGAVGPGPGTVIAVTTSQTTGRRKAIEPGTHMITPAIAWSSLDLPLSPSSAIGRIDHAVREREDRGQGVVLEIREHEIGDHRPSGPG